MSRYISIKCGIHTDPDFDAWTFDAVGLYIYLFTNEHVNGLTGIGRISRSVMIAETKLTPKRFEAAVEIIGPKVRWYEDGTYWVVARSSHCCYKSDGSVNEKLVASVRAFLAGHRGDVLQHYAEKYPNIVGYRYPINTPSIGDPPQPSVSVYVNGIRIRNKGGGIGNSQNEAATVPISDPPPSFSGIIPLDGTMNALVTHYIQASGDFTGQEDVVARHFSKIVGKYPADRIEAAIDALCASQDGVKPWHVCDELMGSRKLTPAEKAEKVVKSMRKPKDSA